MTDAVPTPPETHTELLPAALIEMALERGEGILSDTGA